MSSSALIPARFYDLWHLAPVTRPGPVTRLPVREESVPRDDVPATPRDVHLRGLWHVLGTGD